MDFFGNPATNAFFVNDAERLRFAINAAGIGIWEWDLSNNQIVWDARCRELFGIFNNPSTVYEDVIGFIHPEDAGRVDAAVKAAISGANGGLYDIIYRIQGVEDGVLRWVHFNGTAYFDQSGNITRFGGIGQDITGRILAEQSHAREVAAAQELTRLALKGTGTGIYSLNLLTDECEYTPDFARILTGDESLQDAARDVFVNHLHPDDFPERNAALASGLASGTFTYEVRAIWTDQSIHRVRIVGAYVKDALGQPVSINGTIREITHDEAARLQREADLVRLHAALSESEQRFRDVFEQAPMAIALLSGPELTIELGNDRIFELWGKDRSITGQQLIKALPELDGQIFIGLLQNAYRTGEAFFGTGVQAQLMRNGQLEHPYFDFAYTPVRDATGAITGIMVLATEVTEREQASQAIAASEAKFRSLIEEAPFPTALYLGPDLVIDTANEAMIGIWGKTKAVIGQELATALPELEGQPFFGLLREVYQSGITYSTKEQHADLLTDGTMKRYWFNFTYKPLRNADGAVYAILNMAVDVSEQVVNRLAIEKSEKELASAIELAGLGTWTINVGEQTVSYSGEFEEWFGIPSNSALQEFFTALPERDGLRLRQSINRAIQMGADGEVNIEHTVVSAVTGQQRVIHSRGKPVLNSSGEVVLLEGIGHDVTMLRQTQEALELLVQERTEALAITIADLQRSNEELAQYAYVASHDLQEPLRKIQIFSDMLEQKEELRPGSLLLAQKISQSANRMSQLIRDLLEFSRLLKADTIFQPLHLNEIVAAVLNDFELIAQEKGASFNTMDLPVIEGVGLQMNQLFYNLVGNSLKFTKPGIKPQIDITVSRVSPETAAEHVVRLIPFANYYRICVKDNGIGFENQYSEQIFEVFKRLHTREVYPGSGIGLALCRRIIANHHGALFTESGPGQGATFCIILPDRQEAGIS
ncbi:MAG: PAS domain S-box protein [Sphingobacteriales bacterium]|nr:MAG: PAS domain S-box protein [Sphingobacteriales bacterium]